MKHRLRAAGNQKVVRQAVGLSGQISSPTNKPGKEILAREGKLTGGFFCVLKLETL